MSYASSCVEGARAQALNGSTFIVSFSKSIPRSGLDGNGMHSVENSGLYCNTDSERASGSWAAQEAFRYYPDLHDQIELIAASCFLCDGKIHCEIPEKGNCQVFSNLTLYWDFTVKEFYFEEPEDSVMTGGDEFYRYWGRILVEVQRCIPDGWHGPVRLVEDISMST